MDPHPLNLPEPPRGPLHGIGVLVTRPARQSGAFASRLAALGASPVVFPAIVILPPDDRAALDDVHRRLRDYAAAIFVSANAVEYGVGDPAFWPPGLTAFAPGPGTAEALAAVGIRNVQAPANRFDSEGLLALPALMEVAGKRVVIFRGDGGRDLLADTLRARGARVDFVSCYRRARPSSGAQGLEEALRQGRVDAVTVTSSEGLRNLWDVIGADARRLLMRRPVFVPHLRIADEAGTLGLDVIVTGGSDAGLVDGLLEWAANRQPTP